MFIDLCESSEECIKGPKVQKGYIYLASPYSHPDPYVREVRYLQAARVTTELLAIGIWTYSPIVHNHNLAKGYGLAMGWDRWQHFDRALIAPSRFMAILQLPEWEQSEGIKGELSFCLSTGKDVAYISVDDFSEVVERWNRP